MMAPGVPQLMAEFGTSNNMVATFVVSIFVLGFAVGPLLMAPMSEIYGRVPVYHVSNILFVIFSAACALSTSIEMLMVFRFFAGLTGVAVVTCGSGTVADLMPTASRGKAMAIWSMGPLFGPVIGPVCAGFLVEATTWRWVFWVITIVVSLLSVPLQKTCRLTQFDSLAWSSVSPSSSSERRTRRFCSSAKPLAFESKRATIDISHASRGRVPRNSSSSRHSSAP